MEGAKLIETGQINTMGAFQFKDFKIHNEHKD